MSEFTVVIIKPDAVASKFDGYVLKWIVDSGLSISNIIMTTWSEDMASAFYSEHKGKPFFDDLVKFMSSGPLYCLTLTGEDAIAKWRQLCGATDPKKAEALTIRGLYGSKTGPMMHNAVHGSDSPESAARESELIRQMFLQDYPNIWT